MGQVCHENYFESAASHSEKDLLASELPQSAVHLTRLEDCTCPACRQDSVGGDCSLGHTSTAVSSRILTIPDARAQGTSAEQPPWDGRPGNALPLPPASPLGAPGWPWPAQLPQGGQLLPVSIKGSSTHGLVSEAMGFRSPGTRGCWQPCLGLKAWLRLGRKAVGAL